MRWQKDRPIPVPAPTSLVVKKGSKMRGRISFGDAGPGVGDPDDDVAALWVELGRDGYLPLAFPVVQRLLGVDQEIDQTWLS